MNNKKGSISILSENIHDAMARAEKAEAEIARLMARDERWKRAVREYHFRVVRNYDAIASCYAHIAMQDGNLEALEKAVGIKEKS